MAVNCKTQYQQANKQTVQSTILVATTIIRALIQGAYISLLRLLLLSSSLLLVGVEVEGMETSLSLSSLEVLLTSRWTSLVGSARIKLRHSYVKWPAAYTTKENCLASQTQLQPHLYFPYLILQKSNRGRGRPQVCHTAWEQVVFSPRYVLVSFPGHIG